MPRSNIISGSTDWDTITDPGVYKVQTSTFQNGKHTPLDDDIDVYTYGTLIVLCAIQDRENRKVQVFIPDTIETEHSKRVTYRTYNSGYHRWLYNNFLG